MSRKQQRKKDRQKKSPSRNANRPAAGVSPTHNSRAVNLLLCCLFVLVIGLAIRFALSRYQRSQLSELVSAVQTAESQENWAAMEIAARSWAEQTPLEFEPWDAASRAALKLGDPAQAASYLAQMPDDSPIEAFHSLGELQVETLGLPLDAEQTLLRTLETYPTDTETHLRLMFLYTMTCRRDEAIKEAKRAIEIGSDVAGTYSYLFAAPWITYTNGYDLNRQWLQATPDSETLAAAAVVHLLTNQNLHILARQSGLTSSPSEFYEAAVTNLRNQFPDDIELLAAELDILCKAGDIDVVSKRLSNAPEPTVSDARFWRAKGWYHAATGEIEPAIEAFEKSLEIQPMDWLARQQYSQALREAGRGYEALEQQNVAERGKRIADGIRKSPRIDRLEPASLFNELTAFFLDVDLPRYAERLQSHLD